LEVSLDDISRIIRLVREVCDRWDDPRAWRDHLLLGACRILDGNVGTILDVTQPAPGRLGTIRAIAAVGLPEPMRKALIDTNVAQTSDRDLPDASKNMMPGLAKYFETFTRQGWVTASRNQITSKAAYYASVSYQQFRRHADCDDYLWSMRSVDLPSRLESIGVDRPHGAPPFGIRERTLMKLLHDEIAPLIGVRLATEEHLCRDGLSKRLRETLSHLLEGKSEKQVAAEMGLGGRTIHEYVTMIYQHFNVTSRAELLAYFVRREPKPRPRDGEQVTANLPDHRPI
jgi:DNA-binding CsgD family transcriptional regulator